MNPWETFFLMMFSAFVGGSLGHFYRLVVKVPSWLFSD